MTPAPTRLRLDHLAPGQPCGSPRPRGSWWLPAGATAQHAYAVRVLDPGAGPGADSVLVDLDVPAFVRGRAGSWQVRVWTDLGTSAWSVPAPWTPVELPA